MLSELFRIPVEAGGVPVLGVGVLLALWIIGFAAAMAWRAARHGVDADFWASLQPAVVGALVLGLAPLVAPRGIPIRGYGVMLLAAISLGVAMAVHRARRHGIAPDTVLAMVFWLFVAGIAGARAFFVIEYWEQRFAGQPPLATLIDVLQFTEGGLVVYGSLLGGVAAFAWFAWRHRLPLRATADILASCFMAGLAVGRVGCLLNGCCYGGACDLPWAVTFPADSPAFADHLAHGALHGLALEEGADGRVFLREDGALRRVEAVNGDPVRSLADAAAALGAAHAYGSAVEVKLDDQEVVRCPPSTRTRSLPIHPTQVYATINAGLTSWFLWSWFPHRRRDGEVALLMLTIYPLSRFLLEAIRTDESAIFGTGMSISQNVSLIVLALAAAGWAALLRSPPGRLEEVRSEPPASARTPAAGAA